MEAEEGSSVIFKKLFTTFSFAAHSPQPWASQLSFSVKHHPLFTTSLVITISLPYLTCPNYPLSSLPCSSLFSSPSNHNSLFLLSSVQSFSLLVLLSNHVLSSMPLVLLSSLYRLSLLAPHLLFIPHFTLTVPSCPSPHSPIPPLSPCPPPPRWRSKTASSHHPLQRPWWPTLELVHTLNQAAGATLHRPQLT